MKSNLGIGKQLEAFAEKGRREEVNFPTAHQYGESVTIQVRGREQRILSQRSGRVLRDWHRYT